MNLLNVWNVMVMKSSSYVNIEIILLLIMSIILVEINKN